MDYNDFLKKWNKLVNSPAFSAMQSELKKINQFSEILNSPTVKFFNKQQALMAGFSPIDIASKAIPTSAFYKQNFSNIPLLKDQFSEINKILEPSRALFSAFATDNKILSAFNNSGVFDAISALSKNMSALSAINKLNNIAHIVEPIDFDINISAENKVLVNSETLSNDEILEFTKEFEALPLDESSLPTKVEKFKSKKGSFFLSILGLILTQLFLSPIIEDVLTVARERLGIDKILENLDIKTWTNEIFDIILKANAEEHTEEPSDLPGNELP